MKKDIIPPVVKDVYIAIIQETNEEGHSEWISYLINNKTDKLEAVLVSTRGYGELDGEQKKTATFRHFLDEIEAKSFKKIEPIPEELFAINNEFLLSFYIDKKLFDKKYIFLPESITHQNTSNIPLINKLGILI